MKRRYLSILLILALILSVTPIPVFAEIASGIFCGVDWVITDAGELQIGNQDGTTAELFTPDPADDMDAWPWLTYWGDITSVVFVSPVAGNGKHNDMFSGLENLVTADLSLFDTTDVTNMNSMFWNCAALTSLDISGFDMSLVVYNSNMLSGLTALTELSLGTQNKLIGSGFDNASSWSSDMVNFYTAADLLTAYDASPTTMNGIYKAVTAHGDYDGVDWLITGDGELQIGAQNGVTTQTFAYNDLREYTIWPWYTYADDIKSVRFVAPVNGNGSHGGMFQAEAYLATADMANFNTSAVTDLSLLFADDTVLTSIANLNGFNTANVADMSYMFQNCAQLTAVDVSSFRTGNAEDINGMFSGCESLTSLDVSSFDTSNVVDLNGVFATCTNLAEIRGLENWNTSNVGTTSTYGLFSTFEGCSSLTELDLSNWDTSNVNAAYHLFENCTSLVKLDLSGRFDLINADTQFMFEGGTVPALRELTINEKFKFADSGFNVLTTTWSRDMIDVYDAYDLADGYDVDPAGMAGTWVVIGDYMVTFDANGGTGAMPEMHNRYDGKLTLPANGFEAPEGLTFRGWDLGAAGATVSITADTVAVAQWGSTSSGSPKTETYDFTQPEEGVGSGIVDDEAWTWGERANLPTDTATLYMILSNNSVSEDEDNPLPFPEIGTEHFLASDDIWVLPEEDPDFGPYDVITVQVCQDNEPIYLANGDGKVDQDTFGNSDFYVVGVGTGDTKIDYPNLQTGDIVTNKTFNGVYVTRLPKSNNPNFDSDLAKLKSDTIASFRAFELDHPEVFWLNGSIKLRVLTVTISGEQTSFIFMTLVDDSGFTMRIAEYAEKGSIEKGIAQRDAAVAAIIAQIPAGASTREKVANLNKWFTLNNEYNRSADLSAIGYTPHRSLKSLTGNFGINGPVCDGYSRGFKTVCDRLGIPVVLETGVASIGTHSELHMWMSIKVDGTWYGTDCTWNDPIVKGKDGKVSGYENEKYLLVGDDTVVDGAKFSVSHPANKTPGGVTGVLFASLILSTDEIDGYTPLDYEDVRTGDWFYDYVQHVTKLGLMNGTSPNVFSPQGTATRGQIVQILYNIAGQPEVDEVSVEGWFGVPATWAMNKGIVAGYADGDFHGNDPVTREQLATILWAFEGAPAQEGTLRFADADIVSEYAVQALLWAKKEDIIGGKPGNLADPQGTATRAEIATIFSNYMK